MIIWQFFIYSFLGWLVEIAYTYHKHKKYLPTGLLFGPFCPIYSFGALIVIYFLYPLQNNLVLFFIMASVTATVLEYSTGIVMKKLFNAKWWDYSDEKFNLNGIICLKISLYWGILAVLLVKIIHPQVSNLINFLNNNLPIWTTNIIIIYFLSDFIFTLYSLKKPKKSLPNLI